MIPPPATMSAVYKPVENLGFAEFAVDAGLEAQTFANHVSGGKRQEEAAKSEALNRPKAKR